MASAKTNFSQKLSKLFSKVEMNFPFQLAALCLIKILNMCIALVASIFVVITFFIQFRIANLSDVQSLQVIIND